MTTQATARAKARPAEPEEAVIEMPPSSNEAVEISDQKEIAELAYQLWQARGCPHGSPEDDWFRAEEQLKARNNPPEIGNQPTASLPLTGTDLEPAHE